MIIGRRKVFAPLKQTCVINPETLSDSTSMDYEFDYIDIGNVEMAAGVIETERMTFANAPSRARRIVRRGDVIVSTVRTYLRAIAAIDERHDGAVASTGFAVLRAKDGVDQRFLAQVLKSEDFVRQVAVASVGVSYPAINPSTLAAIKIPVPCLDEQRAVAAFLDAETARVDALIEKKELLCRRLVEKQKADEAILTTRGLSDGTSLGATGLAACEVAPAHWRVRRIATVFYQSSEMGQEGLPVLSVSINTGISDKELGDEDRHRVVTQIEDKTSYKRVRPGDLVYNMMRAWQGAFGVAKVDGLVSPAYVVARPMEDIHAPYFEPLLRTPMWIEDFRRASRGIADFRQRLYWEHFRQIGVLLPPLDEQIAIADELRRRANGIEGLMAPIKKSAASLREFRSALITAAVNGQIDLEAWRRRGDTDRRLDRIEADMAVEAAE